MTLKVLHIIPTLDRSGTEKQLTLLATGLPRDEFEVHVCALTRGGPYEETLCTAGIPVTVLGKSLKIDPLAYLRLKRFIARGGMPSPRAGGMLSPRKHALEQSTNHTTTAGGMLSPRKHGDDPHANHATAPFDIIQTWLFAGNSYGRLAARGMLSLRKHAAPPILIASERCVDTWKSPNQLMIDRWLARRTDRIVVNSQAVSRFYEAEGIPPEKLTVIYNGIVPEPLPPVDRPALRTELGLPPGAKVMGFVGRLWPQKGLKDFIWAADLLKCIWDDFYALIIGDGPERARLEEFTRQVEITDRVFFLGHRSDVPRLLQALDVFVLPSYFEGLPNAVLEAMLAGLPVVATAIPGTDEVVVDGQTGYLVPPHEPALIARAVRRLIDNPDLAQSLASAARQRVLDHFTADRMVQAHAELYRQLAAEKGVVRSPESIAALTGR